MARTIALVLLVGMLIAGAGWMGTVHAQGGPSNAIGKQCTVQFKRDLLGVHANMPVGPNVDNINGAEVSVHGTLLALDIGDQIVLRQGDKELWIPKSNILMIAVEPAKENN